MVGGPRAWHHSGHHCYLWHSFIELFTLSKGERRWRQQWLCGCLIPSIFLCQCSFSSVSNPARAPAAPRMASPKAQDSSFQNYPLPPPQTALYRVPLWPGCGCEAKLTLLEWLQWQQCFSAYLPGLAPIWSASLYHPRLEPRRLTVKQADWLIDWLDKSQEAHNTTCSIQNV